MIEELWFLYINGNVINVFDDREIALEEKEYLEWENPYKNVTLEKFSINDLVEDTEEYEMADMRGYF